MALRQPRPPEPMSVEDYLAYEQRSPERHEYLDGQIYAFAGASRQHNVIATNLYRALFEAVPPFDIEINLNDVYRGIGFD